jgi:hypothetical protein
MSYFSWPVIENLILNKPLLRDHLSYKVTFSLSQRRPLNTGFTVNTKRVIRSRNSKKYRLHNGNNKKNKTTNNDLQNTIQKTKEWATRTLIRRVWRYPPPPLQLEKILFFGVKSWFFTRNTPKISLRSAQSF